MPIEPRAWPEMQSLLLPLSAAEHHALATSIAADGVLVPIIVLPDGRIIDGHHRWELSGGTAPFEVHEIADERAFALGMTLNLARRQMSPEQIREFHERLRRQKARRREIALGLRASGKTQTEVAALLGVPQQTLSDWENASNTEIGKPCLTTITAMAVPDLRISVPRSSYERIYERTKDGETQADIAADYKISRQRVGQIIELIKARNDIPPELAEELPLPDRKYRCIVIDPPWPMKKIEREVRQKQGRALDYPVMSLDEIGSLPIGNLAVAAGCHVYLWVTHRFLPMGLGILERWGVKYQCVMTWIKPTGFTPFSWMYNTEHVLFGRIGNLKLDRLGLKLSFEAPVSRHSEKPAIFYERIRLATPGPRLDMFARRARAGFDVWGNEVAAS